MNTPSHELAPQACIDFMRKEEVEDERRNGNMFICKLLFFYSVLKINSQCCQLYSNKVVKHVSCVVWSSVEDYFLNCRLCAVKTEGMGRTLSNRGTIARAEPKES